MTVWSEVERQFDEYLQAGHEREDLDYKLTIDLSSRRDKVELAKDVGAFLDKGGALVIGCDDHGRPQEGIPERVIRDWDESRLRAKLSPYLGKDFPLRVTVHERAGVNLAFLFVPPHPDGCAVFLRDGHADAGAAPPVFRSGDIFTRHGTASERANQEDMRRVLAKSAQHAVATERAASSARAAAYEVAIEVDEASAARWGRPEPRGASMLVGSVAFAASRMPADLTRRIFYDDDFESLMRNLLEGPHVRRAGHYFASRVQRDPHQIRMSGIIENGKTYVPCYLDARVRGDGSVVVGFAENTLSWDWDEVVAWWYLGAWSLAVNLLTSVEASGTLFSCHLTQVPGQARAPELSLESTLPIPSRAVRQPDIDAFCHEQVMRIHRMGRPVPFVRRAQGPRRVDFDAVRRRLARGRRTDTGGVTVDAGASQRGSPRPVAP